MFLKEKEDITDIRIRGSILHHVLEMISKDKQDYTSLSKEEIYQYVRKEFAFAKKYFCSKSPGLIHKLKKSQTSLF